MTAEPLLPMRPRLRLSGILWALLVLLFVGSVLAPLALAAPIVTVDGFRIPALFVLPALLLTAGILRFTQRQTVDAPLLPLHRAADGLLGAIVLSGLLLWIFRTEQVSDFGSYVELGRSLAQAPAASIGGMSAWRPPGMTFALGVPLMLGIPALAVVWLVNALSCLLTWHSLRKMLSTGQISPSNLLVTRLLITLGVAPFLTHALSELPALALVCFSLRVLFIHEQPRLRDCFLAGLCIGLAALFRPICILQAPLMAAVWLLWRSSPSWRLPLMRGGLLCLGAAAAISPWTLRNAVVLHAFVPISTNGGEVFYSANAGTSWQEQGRHQPKYYRELRNAVPDEVQRNKEGFRRGFSRLLHHPVAFLISLPWRAGQILIRFPAVSAVYNAQNQHALPPKAVCLVLLTGTLAAYWCSLARLRQIRARMHHVVTTNAHAFNAAFCLIGLFAACMMFECAGRYALTVLPFVLVLWCFAETSPLSGEPD